jgi:phospholipid/cholesterol/gamma-HCH transport system permease protein
MDLRINAIQPKALLSALSARSRPRGDDRCRLDLSGLRAIDDVGVATIRAASRRLATVGITLELHGASPEVSRALQDAEPAPRQAESQPTFLEQLGKTVLSIWASSAQLVDLCFESVRGVVTATVGRKTFTARDVTDQIERMGADAVAITASLSFLLGLVLAFQTWVQLHSFGTELYVLEFVTVGMARGFAPFIVAILLAGRTGSAIAAELATMEMRNENDVLRVMGISPVRHLVTPRLLAMTLAIPALEMLATAAGVAGGFVVTLILDPDWMSAARAAMEGTQWADIWLGAVKSVLFGWVIVFASAFSGFHSGYGPLTVGKAATRAVVSSIFFIMIVDAIVTTVWTMAQ